MNTLAKFEVVKLPKLWIVGKEIRYSDDALQQGDNRLPTFWNACYEENLFAPLEAQAEILFEDAHAGVFIDWYLGDGDFSHIVGMLMKAAPAVPKGYVVRELAETEAAWCWVKCKAIEETRAVPFDSIAKAITDIGRSCAGMRWCVDSYHRTRSTMPDENGYVILDCLIPLDEGMERVQ